MDIAILDDFKSDREELQKITAEFFEEKGAECNVFLYENARKLLDDFKNHSFSLALMDIKMDGMSGLDAARAIRKSSTKLPIVFVTVEKGFALDGYEVQAADFIVKPFDKERIFSMLNRIFKASLTPQYICIKENRTVKKFYPADILFAETRNHYVEIHTTSNFYRSYMTFDDFCALLPEDSNFQICHRGIVVNLDRVLKLEEQDFLLENGQSVPISRSKRAEIRNAYANYAFERTREIYE